MVTPFSLVRIFILIFLVLWTRHSTWNRSRRNVSMPAQKHKDIVVYVVRIKAINEYFAQKHKSIVTDLRRTNNFTEYIIVSLWMDVEVHKFNGPINSIVPQMIMNSIFGSLRSIKWLGKSYIKISWSRLDSFLSLKYLLIKSQYLEYLQSHPNRTGELGKVLGKVFQMKIYSSANNFKNF